MTVSLWFRQYKIYDLAKPDYTLLYTLPADGVREVKLSSSHLLIVRQPVHKGQHTLQNTTSSQQVSRDSHTDSEGVLPLGSDSREAECCPDSMSQDFLLFEVMSAVNGQVSLKITTPCSHGCARAVAAKHHHVEPS